MAESTRGDPGSGRQAWAVARPRVSRSRDRLPAAAVRSWRPANRPRDVWGPIYARRGRGELRPGGRTHPWLPARSSQFEHFTRVVEALDQAVDLLGRGV